MSAQVQAGASTFRLGAVTVNEDWYRAPEAYIEAIASDDDGGHVHPRKMLKKNATPPGTDAVEWRTRGIYMAHPMMCLLLQKECITILGFNWDKIMKAIGVTSSTERKRVTRAFAKIVNHACDSAYGWMPVIGADAALPARHSGYNARCRRFVPLFLMPFLRKFVPHDKLNDFDMQMDSLVAHAMLTIRVEEASTPHLKLARAQLSANLTKTRTTFVNNLAEELYAMREELHTLRTRVKALEDVPSPPPQQQDDTPTDVAETSAFMRCVIKRGAGAKRAAASVKGGSEAKRARNA